MYHTTCIYILLLLVYYPLYTTSTLIPFTIASHDSHRSNKKIDRRTCLRFRENDVLLEMCPAFQQSDLDSFQALFPDVSILSGLGHDADFNLLYPPIPSLLDSTKQQQVGSPHGAELATLEERQRQQQRADNEPSSSPQLVINQPRGDAASTPIITINGNNKDINNQYTSTSDTKSSSSSTFSTVSSTTQQQQQRPGTNNDNEGGLLLSFEEVRERVLQKEKNDRWSSPTNSNKKRAGGGNLGHMIDSVDGGFADDFGAMFEVGQGPPAANIYAEDEYIEPSRGGNPPASATGNAPVQQDQHQQQKSKPSKITNVPIKSLKERFNYASIDCAATVRGANKEAKGAQSILYESKDQYLLNKCSANKYVIINLCEPVLIDTIVMANFEFFSSTFSEFRVYVADRYPTNDWKLLGQWQARNTRDLQVFKVKNRFGWFENIKIEFLSHYGHEYYCPLSLVRVHGMTMMEYYFLVEGPEDGEHHDLEGEFLWPSEVRDEIIHPNIDSVKDTSPIIPEQEDDHNVNDDPPVILPVNDVDGSDDDDDFVDIHEKKTREDEHQHQRHVDDLADKEDSQDLFSTPVITLADDLIKNEPSTTGIIEELTSTESEPELTMHAPSNSMISQSSSAVNTPAITTDTPSILPTEEVVVSQASGDNDALSSIPLSSHIQASNVPDDPSSSITLDGGSIALTGSEESLHNDSSTTIAEEHQPAPVSSSISDSSEDEDHSNSIPAISNTIPTTNTATSSSSSSNTMGANVGSSTNTASSSPTDDSFSASNRAIPKPSNIHKDNSYTQESIYKTIMKRLNALELNATLSQRYLDEQNKMLNNVFMNMEKRHQDQIFTLLGRLNDTASTRIDGMVKLDIR
ncbi:UNC-like C-terminal-domain-containing protein [Circinella umbellata]|nr:UNC-like C-terminal-domain-containing protein [Circinella umbellata]